MSSSEAKALKKQRQRDARKAKAEQEKAAILKAERDANPPKVDWSEDVDFGGDDDLPKFDPSWKSTIENLVKDESGGADVSTYLVLLEDTTMSRYGEKPSDEVKASDGQDGAPKVRVRVDRKSLSERAKRWGTTTWLAQWLINAVDYCKSQAGKKKLEDWVHQNFGPTEASKWLQACDQEPARSAGKRTGLDTIFNAAAFELGVREDALKIFHWFVSHNHLVQPPRTEPPVQRLPGEPSSSWLPRRHQSIVDGHQFPDMDWEEVRRIAIAQFDMVRDKREVWRTQPNVFLEAISKRAESSLIEETGGPLLGVIGRMTESFKFSLHVAQCSYAHWSRAAQLVEDITSMGLTTPAEIENAYNADRELMWRLASCAATADALFLLLWARLVQVMSNTEYYKPYFRRRRTEKGDALVKQDEAYLRAHPLDNRLDKLVVQTCSEGLGAEGYRTFFDRFDTLLKINPEEIKKFDPTTLQEIGDVAIVYDFYSDFADSSFGQRLIKAVEKAESDKIDSPDMVYRQVGMVNRTRLVPYRTPNPTFCSASIIASATVRTWIEPCSANEPHLKLVEVVIDRSFWHGSASDLVWEAADKKLWDLARSYDQPGRPGSAASAFGLYDPNDSTRPMSSPFYFPCLDPKHGPLKAESTPAPVFPERVELPEEEGRQVQETYKQLPTTLPTTYKLGRKAVKLIHRWLNDEEQDNHQTSQLRWSDFEKALKRLDFDVVRKPHLSLRFDPPATSARPIIFHCRDIDAVISPTELKWISARLKRRYGFTAASFESTAQDSND